MIFLGLFAVIFILRIKIMTIFLNNYKFDNLVRHCAFVEACRQVAIIKNKKLKNTTINIKNIILSPEIYTTHLHVCNQKLYGNLEIVLFFSHLDRKLETIHLVLEH